MISDGEIIAPPHPNFNPKPNPNANTVPQSNFNPKENLNPKTYPNILPSSPQGGQTCILILGQLVHRENVLSSVAPEKSIH